MRPLEVPEMTRYLDCLMSEKGCVELFEAELSALRRNNEDTSGLDWADTEGTDVLETYWLVADTPERQAQLGQLCHLRAIAWDAVFRTCWPCECGV